ncbi:MAG: hypothetical protein H6807_05510 [Planctomycetes bacterium]|nr:hypothetical protein [Planctomycetota bacterium]
MLLGRLSNTLTVDQKGRIVVPSRLRESVGLADEEPADFQVGCLVDNCLYLHTEDQHQAFLDNFEQVLGETAQDRMLKTILNSSFVQVSTDKANRLSIPSFLLKKAGIKKEVVVVGMRERVEIWDAAVHAAMEAKHRSEFELRLEEALERAGKLNRRRDEGDDQHD